MSKNRHMVKLAPWPKRVEYRSVMAVTARESLDVMKQTRLLLILLVVIVLGGMALGAWQDQGDLPAPRRAICRQRTWWRER